MANRPEKSSYVLKLRELGFKRVEMQTKGLPREVIDWEGMFQQLAVFMSSRIVSQKDRPMFFHFGHMDGFMTTFARDEQGRIWVVYKQIDLQLYGFDNINRLLIGGRD